MPRKQWYYILAFLILFPLALWLAAEWAEQQSMNELQLESTHHLRLHAHNLLHELEKFELLSQVLSEDIKLHHLLQRPDDGGVAAMINHFLAKTNSKARASVIYLMSTTGKTLASSNWESSKSFVGKNYSFRPYFQRAAKGSVGRYTAVGATSGELGHYIARPIRKQGNLIGVIVIKADLKGQELLYLNRDAILTVADSQGVIFLTGNPDFRFRTIRPLDTVTKKRISDSRQYADLSLTPLPITHERAWDKTTMIVSIRQGDGEIIDYMVRNGMLLEVGWQIQSYSRLDPVRGQIYLTISVTALTLISLLLLALYLQDHRLHLKQLRAAAITDTLTGLYTRRYMNDAVDSLIEQHNRSTEFRLAAVMMDIDFFKKVNDTYGHKAGDLVLQRVAQAIRRESRASDIAIRYGGEEFVVIMLTSPTSDTSLFGERIRTHIKALRFKDAMDDLNVTISIGIAYHNPGEPADGLLERADRQLYKAKNSGRDCICVDQDQTTDGTVWRPES
ncbi:MAG: diguanylate cyclase [Sedimenticola sp.]